MKKLLLALLLLLPLQSQAARLFVASNSDRVVYAEQPAWTTQISISLWIYPTSLPTIGGVLMGLVSDNASTDNGRRVLTCLLNSGGTQRIYFSYHNVNFILQDQYTDYTLTTGVWQHLAFTADYTAHACKIYVNGVSQTTVGPNVADGPPTISAGFPRVGNFYYAGTEAFFFDGRMAEVAIWQDVAVLNQSEVTALARGARPDKVRINPTRYYPLEGWQTTEPDYGQFHLGTTSISGTSRVNGPPVLPR